jgi:hypothetical protein
VIEISSMMVLGDDGIGPILLIWKHKCFAQPLGRLG